MKTDKALSDLVNALVIYEDWPNDQLEAYFSNFPIRGLVNATKAAREQLALNANIRNV